MKTKYGVLLFVLFAFPPPMIVAAYQLGVLALDHSILLLLAWIAYGAWAHAVWPESKPEGSR